MEAQGIIMNYGLLISVLIAGVLFLGFYQILRLKNGKSVNYRLFLIIFLSSWSSLLLMKPYRPNAGLLIISIAVMGMLFLLAHTPRRVPKNRRETKALLEQLQNEKWLEKFFESKIGRLFWLILAFLLWIICYRLVSIYY